MKIEGGVVFIGPESMIKDTSIYEATIVFETPKDAVWTEDKLKEYLDKHTEGEVVISRCKIMDRTGYANMMRKQAEVETKMDEMMEKIKSDIEGHLKQRKQPAHKRFFKRLVNDLFNRE